MNYDKTAKVWALKGISPHYKLVLLNLVFRENKKGECFPSIPTIVGDTKVSRKMVIEALKYFESPEVGLIKKRKRHGKSTVYTTFPEPASSGGNDTSGENATSSENAPISSGENDTSISIHELSNRIIKADIPSYRDSKKAAAVLYRGVEFAKIREAADALISNIPAFSNLKGNEQRIAELLIPTSRANTEKPASLLNQAVDYANKTHSTQRVKQHGQSVAIQATKEPAGESASARRLRQARERQQAARQCA